ncbi:MAG: carbon-nitrogen hydrolase family protein [Deltaproteobacteria bacterium]|nr:carbon-nitrogen hydrolase family protein [Deltaproteobacteria bacterium]
MPTASGKFKICVAQINFHPDDVPGHLAKLKEIILEHRQADLIVFPELILHGHPSDQKPEGFLFRQMMAVKQQIFQEVHGFIRKQDARVILGELHRQGDAYQNVAAYVDARGVQQYQKTHVHWTEHFLPGRRLKVFETPLGRIGVNICFDAAFQEVWRVLALRGAEIIVNISAVPASFAPRYMLRRMVGAAIFNQVHVIYANRPGPFFAGHSAVIDPHGEELVRAGTEECVLEVEIDPAATTRWREEESIFPHRRPLLYRLLANRSKQGRWGLPAESAGRLCLAPPPSRESGRRNRKTGT